MVATNFVASLKLVLESEGGNDDDPADHGGRTSRGITQREYDAWRHLRSLSPLDVWKAPQEDIDTIYKEEYWAPNCDFLPAGLDYLVFNNNVLDGPYRSTVLLQQALGVAADGRFGPVTKQAVLSSVPSSVIIKLSEASAAFYKGLHQRKFLNGWLNRVAFVEKNALQMAKGV